MSRVGADEHLGQATSGLLGAMVQAFAGALMSADADSACGERSDQATNTRNGLVISQRAAHDSALLSSGER
jgi:hypothetical protein